MTIYLHLFLDTHAKCIRAAQEMLEELEEAAVFSKQDLETILFHLQQASHILSCRKSLFRKLELVSNAAYTDTVIFNMYPRNRKADGMAENRLLISDCGCTDSVHVKA